MDEGRSAPPLVLKDLAVVYDTTSYGRVEAVKGVSLAAHAGAVLGIVGGSGCGKTTLASTILGMLPGGASVTGGELWFDGVELLSAPDREHRALRGGVLTLIPQNPMTALNPVLTVGYQMVEAIRAHSATSRAGAKERAAAALERVGVPDAKRALRRYPHEFSGGTLQRILTAMAVVNEPRVLIADEPTSALDATIQRQIIALFTELVESMNLALVLISHDFGVIGSLADHVCVMNAGVVVEQGPAAQVLGAPRDPYTRALLDAAAGRAPSSPTLEASG